MNKINNEDFYSIFDHYLESMMFEKFEWGILDCALFVATFIAWAGDESHLYRFKLKYATEKGAYRELKNQGFENLKDYCDKNFKIIKVPFAQRGDIMMHDHCLGLCSGIDSFFLTENQGLTKYKTLSCQYAWRFK